MLNWVKQQKWYLAAAAFLLIAAASLLTPFYAEVCEKNAYTGNKDCTAHHMAISFILCLGQWLDIHAGAVGGVATVVLAIITWRLVTLGKEQTKTTRAQLRAYVMVAAVHGTDIAPDIVPKTTVRFKNFGQTPAHNIRVIIGMGFAPYPFTDIEWFSRTGKPAAEFGRPLGPEDNVRVPIDLNGLLTAEKIRAMQEGRWALWLNGKICYSDVFDQPQETEFGMFTNNITGMGSWAAIDGMNRCT